MTPAELAAIRERDAAFIPMTNEQADQWGDDAMIVEEDRRALLREVDRLRDWQRRVVQAWDHAESGGFTHAMLALIEEAGRG